MNKLISNPFECGYSNIEENYREGICKHPKNSCGNCPGPNFPINCPLQDGMTIKAHHDAIMAISAETDKWIY